MAHFVYLTITIQPVVDYEFAWFPKIHQSHEDVSSSWHDLLGLLGFEHEQQHIVIQKIKSSSARLPIEQLLTFIMLDI